MRPAAALHTPRLSLSASASPALVSLPALRLRLRLRLRRLRKRLLAARPSFCLVFVLTNVAVAVTLFLSWRLLTARPDRPPAPRHASSARAAHLAAAAPAPFPGVALPSVHRARRNRARGLPAWFSRRASGARYELTPAQHEVRNATRAMYRAYFARCRGRDEYIPERDNCADWYNVGLTTLDSVDTLLLMGLTDEYEASRAWAEESLHFSAMRGRVSTFELIIRALGGMLSAHELSGHEVWLRKSVELGDLLLPFFDATRTGCPPMNVDFRDDRRDGAPFAVASSVSTPADAGTLQLELRTLSALSGDPRYAAAGDRCVNSMLRRLPQLRLVPPEFDVQSGAFAGSRYTIGGSVDSFYEMLLKTWVASGGGASDATLRATFERAVDAIYARLHGVGALGLHFLGELRGDDGPLRRQMDHLACFFPGALALGASNGLGGGARGSRGDEYMPRARLLARSCFEMTRASAAGLAAEITEFGGDRPRPQTGHDACRLRPEVAEALFYLARTDGAARATYTRWGRELWGAMRRGAQVRGRADGVLGGRVRLLGRDKPDGQKLESFVLAETVKYLFLLFDERTGDDAPLPLDEWVFNTEAHPVRVRARG